MAIATGRTAQPEMTDSYARLEEKILERDQAGASNIFYDLVRAGRPLPELVGEIIRIHAPYTHVPYHQRLDDGVVKFVNNDHCFLSSRVGLPLASMIIVHELHDRSEEHTSELQSRPHLVCRLLLEKKKNKT